jgi:hypothetical protein
VLYTLNQFCALYVGQFCALYIGPILCFIHWSNSVLYALGQFWTNSVLYTLDQFCALYIGPILCFIHWTNSVLYTLDQFCALYTGQIVLYTLDQFCALYTGPILCFIHWTNSVLYTIDKFKGAASVNTEFPWWRHPGSAETWYIRKETVYRLCLLLVHVQLVRHADCKIMHGHTYNTAAEIPSTYLRSQWHCPLPHYRHAHTHTHTHTAMLRLNWTTKHTAFWSFTMFYISPLTFWHRNFTFKF